MHVPGIELSEIPVTDHVNWAFAAIHDNWSTTATIEFRTRAVPEYYRNLAHLVRPTHHESRFNFAVRPQILDWQVRPNQSA